MITYVLFQEEKVSGSPDVTKVQIIDYLIHFYFIQINYISWGFGVLGLNK